MHPQEDYPGVIHLPLGAVDGDYSDATSDLFSLLVLGLLLLQYRLLVTSVRGLLPLPVHIHLGDKVAGREVLRLNFLDWNHIQLSLT